ncbi:F-box domain-containing protein [Mycena indigotica]|uniref:F-box domain-containing protein n=1 Tax=Mycena indigotica TaxID=2126181 RepID=A0A8H6W609_9AGAR|nr:F-box domain-containing protein [Mycena indigotica]KAF7307094.1 F-box domain-containing protein [Mycena indigotica]
MLPLDIYIAILESVEPQRAELDAVSTLVNCLKTNRLLHEAAARPGLWEAHYRVRYQHSNRDTEAELTTLFNDDWRLKYAERRRRDREALALLEQMVLDREHRYEYAATLAVKSFDIWDAFEVECILPAPALFGTSVTYALTRRYWAEGVLNMILRSSAIKHWGGLVDGGNSVSFVDAFSSLSCFFGKSFQEISSSLAALNEQCRMYLLKKSCEIDPESPGYNLSGLCTEICHFMSEDQGFGPVESTRFYNVLNHFPHAYLDTNKKTLPIYLVHVFVSLARSLGIPASPVEFPGRVLVHVASPPGADDFMVDVFGSSLVSLRHDLPAMLLRLGIAPDNIERYVAPCGAAPMLLRAARNIFSSLQNSDSPSQAAVYVTVCIHLLLSDEPQLVSHMLSRVPSLDPLYCSTFLADMRPLLQGGNVRLLDKICASVMETEKSEAAALHLRTDDIKIAHYVGMTFKHRVYGYTGCIVGWDPVCAASDEWKTLMQVGRLDRGADQPFYHVISLEGTQRYVAEDNIAKPVELTAELAMLFLEQVSIMGRYFSDAYTHPEAYRGRWRLSPELQRQYPNDEDAARKYDDYPE